MDFFNSSNNNSEDKSDVSDFAQAIADRFHREANILTARLPDFHPSTPDRQLSSSSSSSSPSFPTVAPVDLHHWLADSAALIVDIRPHAAHASARIPHAISLCVPSTLLKRPLFSLQKLCAMLPSHSARCRFSAWRSSSRILVYDADSHSISDSSNISGLLRKFKADGFQGELAWLSGGFQAIWKDRRDIVDLNPPDPENDDDDDEHDKSSSQSVLRTRHLPMAAFSATSIHTSPFAVKQRQHPLHLSKPPSQPTSSSSFHATNPFFDAIRQNMELSHGITERIPLQLPRRVRKRIKDLPFPWLQDIAKSAAPVPRRPRTLSDNNSTTSDSETEDDSDIPSTSEIEEGKDALATQFYKIELAEQKRLMAVMERHSRESGHPIGPAALSVAEQPQKSIPFPFSITAGVEKGAKNRYRHIWPFEHARVRLRQKKEADDDYVNASYVQPLGTSRRYIATQGPLPATFTDFWTLCWEQNVHVIVMLTREVEGTTVKCGSYWTDTEFGPLRLKLVSTEGLAPPERRPYLAPPASSSKPMADAFKATNQFRQHDRYLTKRSETVKRTFELSHTEYPAVKPRKIVHLQYLEWPDMNVPDDPRGVLGLIKQVEEAVRESREDGGQDDDSGRSKGPVCTTEIDEKTGVAKHAMGWHGPVLLHCSAGVGRTGGFIAIDAVLDAVRVELKSTYGAKKENDEEDHMDLDVGTSTGARMEVDHHHSQSESTAEDVSPSPPPPDHKFNKAGTIRWAENVRDETGVEGERVSAQPYASGSSSRSASNPELIVHKSSSNGNSSSSSANGDRTSRSSGSGGVYLTTSLGTSVSGASTTSSAGGSKEKVDIGGRMDSRSSSHSLSQEQEQSTHSSFASSEGEPPSRSMSPSDDIPHTARPSLNVLNLPATTTSCIVEPEAGDVYASEASGAQTIDTASTTETVAAASGAGYDFKEPRPLHENFTPPLLSSFEEPILDVVQDMREQRMSLCQSLRQYVFVHAAVIEGSLMVLDEEKEIAEGLSVWTGSKDGKMDSEDAELIRMRTTPEIEIDEESFRFMFSTPPPPSSSDSGASTPSVCSGGNTSRPSPLSSRSSSRSRSRSVSSRRRRYQHHHHLPVPPSHPHSSPSQALLYSNDAPSLFASSSYSYSYSFGKRPSSPTELPKEDKKGDVMLSKRPSMERKRKNMGGVVVRSVSSSAIATTSTGIGDGSQGR